MAKKRNLVSEMLNNWKIGVAFVAAVLPAASYAHSDEIVCGTTYIVEKADSLSRISEWAYGTSRYVEEIHEANIGVIGPNHANLAIGMALNIPCLEEEGTGQTVVAADSTTEVIEPAAEEAEQDSKADLMAEAENLLTVDGFDLEKVATLLETADLPDSEKTTLRNAVVVAKDDPAVLRHVLAHISGQLGL